MCVCACVHVHVCTHAVKHIYVFVWIWKPVPQLNTELTGSASQLASLPWDPVSDS